jgi:hypothetical protein
MSHEIRTPDERRVGTPSCSTRAAERAQKRMVGTIRSSAAR